MPGITKAMAAAERLMKSPPVPAVVGPAVSGIGSGAAAETVPDAVSSGSPVTPYCREAQFAALARSFRLQLELFRTTLELGNAGSQQQADRAERALGKLAAAVDGFGDDLQLMWGMSGHPAGGAEPSTASRRARYLDCAGCGSYMRSPKPVNWSPRAVVPQQPAEEVQPEPTPESPLLLPPVPPLRAYSLGEGAAVVTSATLEVACESNVGPIRSISACESTTAFQSEGSTHEPDSKPCKRVLKAWHSVTKKLLLKSGNPKVDPGPELWKLWTEPVANSSEHAERLVMSTKEALFAVNEKQESRSKCEWCQCLVANPTSPRRVAWDVLSICILTYDLFTLPLTVFDYDEIPATQVFRLITSVFWTLDIAVSFFVGYDVHGQLEMRPEMAAWMYVRTWFLADMLIVTLDWILLVIGMPTEAASVGRLGKSLRVLRVVRLLRFLRIAKLAKLTEKMGNSVFSSGLFALFSISKWLMCLLLICHVVACSWYWVGSEWSTTTSWLSQDDLPDSMPHRYAMAFHWSFAQFTPATSPIHPKTLSEEVFNITLIFIGLVVFSSFLGTVTTTITALRARALEQAKQNTLFKQYVANNNVSWELGRRITNFAKQHHRRRGNRIMEKDVYFLKGLPETLLIELRCQVNTPYLSRHPFFEHMKSMHPLSLMFVCHLCCAEAQYVNGDELFFFHADATRMFFMVEGVLDYFAGPHESTVSSAEFSTGQWVGEPTLWVRRRHTGRLVARNDADVVYLESEKFRSVLAGRPNALVVAKHYAQLFLEKVAELQPDLDIWSSKEVVENMLEQVRDVEGTETSHPDLADLVKRHSQQPWVL